MSVAECLIILMVALFVLKREHLPGIARFFATIVGQCQYLMAQFNHSVNTQLFHEQLDENTKRAEIADKAYQEQSQENT